MTRKLTTRLLCERYSVTDQTIDRWVASGILPRPMVINGRRYWDEADLEEMERKQMMAPQKSGITLGQQSGASGIVGQCRRLT